LDAVQTELLRQASLHAGDQVIDVACGTGLVTMRAARSVRPAGRVVGVDLSGRMVDAATERARAGAVANASFLRADAEALGLADATFDAALCALGLMYVPDPAQALRELRRVLKPGGRVVLAVWGERIACGWSSIFPIVEAEVSSDLCPLFFSLGVPGALAQTCRDAGFESVTDLRMRTTLEFADADEAFAAATTGGPVALAWSRFDEKVRDRVRRRYLASIAEWQRGARFQVPGEFVVVSGRSPGSVEQAEPDCAR
jgi:ubiquinone/menaquinone biosynthesis C-methylase UbiE